MPDLLDGLPFGTFVGDRAFDADWLLEDLAERGAEAVIPSRRNRTAGDRDAVRQDRRELRGRDSPRRRCGRRKMTVNRP